MLRVVNFNLRMFHCIKNGGKPRKQATLFLVLSVPKRKRKMAPPLGSRIQKNQPSSQSACLRACPTPPRGTHSPPLGGGEGSRVPRFLPRLVCVPGALEMEHKPLTTAATAHPQSFLIISPFLTVLLATPRQTLHHLGSPPMLLPITPKGLMEMPATARPPQAQAGAADYPQILQSLGAESARAPHGGWGVLARSHTAQPRLPKKGRPESTGGRGGQEGQAAPNPHERETWRLPELAMRLGWGLCAWMVWGTAWDTEPRGAVSSSPVLCDSGSGPADHRQDSSAPRLGGPSSLADRSRPAGSTQLAPSTSSRSAPEQVGLRGCQAAGPPRPPPPAPDSSALLPGPSIPPAPETLGPLAPLQGLRDPPEATT